MKLSKLIPLLMIMTLCFTACSSGSLPFVPVPEQTTKSTEKPSGASIIPEKTTEASVPVTTAQIQTAEDQTQPTEDQTQPAQVVPALPMLSVPAVQEKTVAIAEGEGGEYRGEAAQIQKYDGKMTKSGQKDTYKLKAGESGLYRFEFSGLVSGFTVTLAVYDQADYRLDIAYGCSNNDGLSLMLEKDKTYRIELEAYDGTGSYTLSIGQQKKTVDLSGYNVLQDAIEFTDQQINYQYVPEEDGVYTFTVAQVKNGVTVTIALYDELGYRLDINYSLGRDEAFTATLEKGKTYLYQIIQYGDPGSFTINIGGQKPVTEIPGEGISVLTDSIRYEQQENLYSFQPKVSGLYRFEIRQIKSGNSVAMLIQDEDGYQLDHIYGVGTGDGLAIVLEGGRKYLFKVIQNNGYDQYTMLVGCPKALAEINGSVYGGVEDSIQFTSQANSYRYIPAVSGTHWFCITDADNGMGLTIRILDEDGMTVDTDYGLRKGEYYRIDLEKGKACTFELVYYDAVGDYAMTVMTTEP